MEHKDLYYNFNPDLPEPFNMIHPFQLKAVRRLLDEDFPEDIEYIILFGGSLDLACAIYSDLDLYVITSNPDYQAAYEEVYARCLKLKKRFDILVSSLPDFLEAVNEFGTVEYEIKQKGLVIYAKQKNNAA
jgi:predicted nucleotidyltransferase